MRNLLRIIFITAVIIFLFLLPGAAAARDDHASTYLRQELVSYLDGGGSSPLPPSSPLRLLKRIPCTATVTWLILGDEPGVLKSYYPVIDHMVTEAFSEDRTTPQGLVLSGSYSGADPDVLISPDINALAGLELHSMALIAMKVGEYEDALELISWSRRYFDTAIRTFYDPARDSFFPIDKKGDFITRYSPEMLLPMLIDDQLGSVSRRRIADRLMYQMTSPLKGSSSFDSMWEDRSLRPMVTDLLLAVGGIRKDRLKGISEAPVVEHSSAGQPDPPAGWDALWEDPETVQSKLFPGWETISSLLILSNLAEREMLLDSSSISAFTADIDSLSLELGDEAVDIDTHIRRISLVNSLLVRLEKMSDILGSGEKVWRIVDDNRWKALSPRFRTLFVNAVGESIEELMNAKRILSRQVQEGTGLTAEVKFPDGPVPLGKSADVDISISSSGERFEIERMYMQIAGTRWSLLDDSEKIPVFPPENVLRMKRAFKAPPGTGPGIVKLPYFLDFMLNGKRIEIHGLASMTAVRGYDVTLNFPSGRKLANGSRLPVNIVLKYPAENSIQGTVDGVLLKEMSSVPKLPARFVIKAGSQITTLPIEIIAPQNLPPGGYPISLNVQIDRRTIAVFEEKLIRPVRWLHLGPSDNQRWIFEDAAANPEELFSSASHPEAGGAGWSEVPAGAFDLDGSVLPDRLYGPARGKGMLLYTQVEMNADTKVNWSLKSGNTVSLWINYMPVVSGSKEAAAVSGSTVLRKGRNNVLVSAWFVSDPKPVLLEFTDESGLPVGGMGNDIGGMARRYQRMAESGDSSGAHDASSSAEASITFQLSYPGASEVALISDFNNWDPDATPMRLEKDGKWRVTVRLRRGVYQYKFLIDRKIKITDPAGASVEPDGFGGLNSTIDVR